MNGMELQVLGAVFAAVFVAVTVSVIFPTPTRLSLRTRPYTAVSRSAFGRAPDTTAVLLSSTEKVGGNALERLTRPFVEGLARKVSGFVGQSSQKHLATRLRQAGLDIDLDDEQRVHNYRVRQLTKAVTFGGAGAAMAALNAMSPAAGLFLVLLGVIIGAAREPARVGKLLQVRVDRMRIELYTVNQQLAMHLRTGGSSVQAVQRIAQRGHGEIIAELREALRLHERGMTASKAFFRISENTPEPFAARTYRMLATGSERGSDLAEGLLALSGDVRDLRRDSLRRNATRRRAQMLLPTIGLMAPILILFVAAPIPSMLFSARG